MKVNLPFVKGPLSHSAEPTRAARADKATAGTPASTSDSPVALSAAARNLAQLENADNDVNIVRVNEIRDALAAGTLKISPERIADGLIASARELLAKDN